MKKYVYEREDLARLVQITLIVGIPLLVFFIFLFVMGLGAMAWCFFITWIILMIILGIFMVNRMKWRSWHRKMERSRVKVKGKVVQISRVQKKANHRGELLIPVSEHYYVIVKYTDFNGEIKRHVTPYLSFEPERRRDITCDVYVNDKDVLAANFHNLYKKRLFGRSQH